MFESLSTRLQDVFKSLRGETRLTPESIEVALREIRLAQSWRMGDSSWRAEMRAASFLTSALFIRCIERAKRLELGLAARGYTGALHLLRCEKQPSPAVIGSVLLLQGVLLALASWVHGGGPWKFR